MSEAWIELQCPDCGENWEANPSDLPPPGDPFTCPHCGEDHPTSEFALTARDLEVLQEFHEE